jgi:hypothetical protein
VCGVMTGKMLFQESGVRGYDWEMLLQLSGVRCYDRENIAGVWCVAL